MKHKQTLRRGLGILLSLVMCLSLLPAAALAEGTSVEINDTNFPDEIFRKYVSDNFDTDTEKGILSPAEIAAVTEIACSDSGIESLKGIEYFTALTTLKCSYNNLRSLDVSNNKALKYLNCHSTMLTKLDISSNTALTELICSANNLTSLDVSNNEALETLRCGFNNLTSLDVSKNTALTNLNCDKNTYDITLGDNNRTFALSSLPGFVVEKADGWDGGTEVNGILTFNSDSDVVTYTYDCGYGNPVTFTLDARTKYTVTVYGGLYGVMTAFHGQTGILGTYAAGDNVDLHVGARDGYTFEGLELKGITEDNLEWAAKGYNVPDRTASFDMPANDVTVTVLWSSTADTNTVIFNAAGGIVTPADVETGEDGKLSTLPTPTRDGYTFDGWFTENGTEAVTTETVFNEDTVLYARWTKDNPPPAKYTVTFDPNGGTLTGWTTTETEDNGTVIYLPAAAREGYIFDGWYTAADGGEKVYTYVTVFTADTTVYAHWTPAAQTKQITEAGFAMQGYAVGANAEDIVITSNTEGLSLVGGYFEGLAKPYSYLLCEVVGEGPDDLLPVTGALKANTEYILMMKADVNAGYDVSGLTEANVTLNSAIAAADCGEYKEESTLGITFELPVLTENDTPDATYTVTVNGSYASVTGAGEYEAGDVVTLAAGSRSGYTFSGWTSDDITIPNADSADTSFVMPAKNVTVTANWTEDAPIVVPIEPVKPVKPADPVEPVKPVIPFTDVPMGAYYEDAVIWAVSEGITSGTTGTTFSPNESCTRAQAVAFLWRAAGSPAPKSAAMPFTDVAKGSYYYDAVLWAIEQGITKGTSDATFSPNATCTRAQIVTFLWRSQNSPNAGAGNPFRDVAADDYYANAVLWAAENGITSGATATTFSPDSVCTRAQIVTFLYRCLG